MTVFKYLARSRVRYRIELDPKKDITAYELFRLLHVYLDDVFGTLYSNTLDDLIKQLPPELCRHLVVYEVTYLDSFFWRSPLNRVDKVVWPESKRRQAEERAQ